MSKPLCLHCGIPLASRDKTCGDCHTSQLSSPIWALSVYNRNPDGTHTGEFEHFDRFGKTIHQDDVKGMPSRLDDPEAVSREMQSACWKARFTRMLENGRSKVRVICYDRFGQQIHDPEQHAQRENRFVTALVGVARGAGAGICFLTRR